MAKSRPTIPEFALARTLSSSYERCIRTGDARIDVELAREQHAGYVGLLRRLGVEVEVLPPLDEYPDAVFVEDVAVIAGERALLTRPGAASRLGEVAGIEDALARPFEIDRVKAPACLDGGDVMRAGKRFFAGLSSRTNRAGIDALARTAHGVGIEMVLVKVGAGLHLKSACTVLDSHTLVFMPDNFDTRPFRRLGFELIEALEPEGANLLSFGNDVLVSAAAPRTAELLGRRGLQIHSIDVSEFHKGDGALTCLSLRRAPAGSWTT